MSVADVAVVIATVTLIASPGWHFFGLECRW
jgi:hypothetical protein